MMIVRDTVPLWQTHVDVKSAGGKTGQLLAMLALRTTIAGPVHARTIVFVSGLG